MEAVIFDIETTGFSKVKDHITQLAAVRVDKRGNILNVLNFYLKIPPYARVPMSITRMTGITKELLNARGVPPETAFKAFRKFSTDAQLVGHNVKRFDLPFIEAKSGMHFAPERITDTLELSREKWGNKVSNKQAALLKRLKISTTNLAPHDALSDVMHLKEAWVKILLE